jgi:hypothetical protein
VQTRARRKQDASATAQLAVEIKWLAGRLPGSFLRTPPQLSPAERKIVARVEEILQRPDLTPFLSILGLHNRTPQIPSGRRLAARGAPFLLGPHVFQVLASVQARNELRQKLPVLNQPAAEVREHLQKAAANCKYLAELVRKGPQPHLALAGKTSANAILGVFVPWTELFEASDDSERQLVAFAELLDRAADWFEALASHVPRAQQNRQTGAGALRVRAAEFLVGVFRRKLGRPYHAHVATLATLISGTPTDADFVKKIEARRIEPSDEESGTD